MFTEENVTNVPRINREAGRNIQALADLKFEEIDVMAKLNKLREDKASGVDELLPRLLCHVKEEITRPLWLLFRKSLDEGTVPEDWKRANVAPIFKSGSRNKAENYRPVSLTSQVCKIFEALMRDAMMKHLEDYQLLKDSQHGFRKGRSCMTNLLTLLETVTRCLDEGDNVDIIFLDFAKAFDKVPHRRLLRKLENHGIGGKILRWIESWLGDRLQRTCIKGKKSSWRKVTSGVPQGSVLGPILFLIYINDLDSGVMSWILKFADDTKIFRRIRDGGDTLRLQQDLDRLIAWSVEWQMLFNDKKCKVMHIGSGGQYVYRMGSHEVESIGVERDLGVMLSNDMKVLSHCSFAYAKANKMLGLLKRTIKYKNTDIMIRLYKALVRPHLEYCSSVWSPYYKKDREMLERVQHRFTKMFPKIKNKSYEERIEELGLWSLEERRNRADLIETFKLVKGLSGVRYENFFEIDAEPRTRGHNLRIVKKRFSTTHRQCTFSQRVINRWNSLDQRTVEASTLNGFKNGLDRLRRTRMGLFLD